MVAKPLPDQDRLNELFHYDPDTGVVTRKIPSGNRQAGSVVGTQHSNGYLQVQVGPKIYLLHRIIWKLVYGVDPSGVVDHADHDKKNNALSNLRCFTKSQNGTNRCGPGGNNVRNGVSKFRDKYQAYITVNRKRIHLGHGSFSECVALRSAAEKKYWNDEQAAN